MAAGGPAALWFAPDFGHWCVIWNLRTFRNVAHGMRSQSRSVWSGPSSARDGGRRAPQGWVHGRVPTTLTGPGSYTEHDHDCESRIN